MLHNAKIAEITTPNGEVFEIVFIAACGESWRESGVINKEENCIIYHGDLQARQKLSTAKEKVELSSDEFFIALVYSPDILGEYKYKIQRLIHRYIDKDGKYRPLADLLYHLAKHNLDLSTKAIFDIYDAVRYISPSTPRLREILGNKVYHRHEFIEILLNMLDLDLSPLNWSPDEISIFKNRQLTERVLNSLKQTKTEKL